MATMWPAVKSMLAEVMASTVDTNSSNSLLSMASVAMELPALPSDGDTIRTDCMADDDCRNCIAICHCCSSRSGAIDCNWASHTMDT